MSVIPTTSRRVFISWVPHARRSSALAEAVGAEAIFIYYFKKKSLLRAAVRYLLSTVKTWWLLLEKRPSLVLCINQPIFLVWTCVAYGQLSGASVVLDHHAGAFNKRVTAWARPLLRPAVRRATLNTVPHREHAELLRRWGGEVLKIGTIPFMFRGGSSADLPDPSVVYICTFSGDEPVETVLEAAGRLPEVNVYVTGSTEYADQKLIASAPPNVTFTGFLPDEDYVALLRGADLVMCLTTRDATLQRGAYEAMSLGQPVVTSDWAVLRRFFPRGTVFVDNSASSIVSGLRQALQDRRVLASEMQDLCAKRQKTWKAKRAQLRRTLGLDEHAKEDVELEIR